MQEPISNTRPVCQAHSPKPDPQYFDKPFEWFVGKYCKLKFPTGRMDAPRFESMWVLTQEVKEIGGKLMLVGVLDNDPYFVREYKDGDSVAFDRNEVCDAFEK